MVKKKAKIVSIQFAYGLYTSYNTNDLYLETDTVSVRQLELKPFNSM